MGVELEPQQQTETGAQWRREQSRTRRGADESEGLYVHRVRTCGRALADHDVELVVFESGIKDLFERGLQAVDFIDEENLAIAKVGKDRCQVALNLQRGPGGLLKSGAEFVGDDVGERRLAQAGRAVEQDVVEGFSARLCRLDGHVEILFDLVLADEFLEALGAELELE